MLDSIKSITDIPDLRKRILFTLLMLAVYRLGAFIPTPGINADAFEHFFGQMGAGLLGLAVSRSSRTRPRTKYPVG